MQRNQVFNKNTNLTNHKLLNSSAYKDKMLWGVKMQFNTKCLDPQQTLVGRFWLLCGLQSMDPVMTILKYSAQLL